MTDGPRWRKGWDDVVPLLLLAAPMLGWSLLATTRASGELVVVIVGLLLGLALRHLLPAPLENLALIPPVAALLVELATLAPTAEGLLLAAGAGVGLLLWAGTEPTSGLSLRRRLEPAVVPALAVGVALGVMFFLPQGSGGQVGLAALALVAVVGLAGWLYLQSAGEAAAPLPTA